LVEAFCWKKTVENMKTDQITIQVDAEAAQAYRATSEEERRKIDSLLSLKLRSATRSQVSLKTYMDEISRRAKERGLTPEILDSLLDEE
jgi:DNA-binding transcriptional ArsR family regulator